MFPFILAEEAHWTQLFCRKCPVYTIFINKNVYIENIHANIEVKETKILCRNINTMENKTIIIRIGKKIHGGKYLY